MSRRIATSVTATVVVTVSLAVALRQMQEEVKPVDPSSDGWSADWTARRERYQYSLALLEGSSTPLGERLASGELRMLVNRIRADAFFRDSRNRVAVVPANASLIHAVGVLRGIHWGAFVFLVAAGLVGEPVLAVFAFGYALLCYFAGKKTHVPGFKWVSRGGHETRVPPGQAAWFMGLVMGSLPVLKPLADGHRSPVSDWLVAVALYHLVEWFRYFVAGRATEVAARESPAALRALLSHDVLALGPPGEA